MHTPRTGLTVRSLTHNIALCTGAELIPEWVPHPISKPHHSLNLLLVPWPYCVSPVQIRATKEVDPETSHRGSFGLFTYDIEGRDANGKLKTLLKTAKDRAGRVDGVVLPELALGRSQHRRVRSEILRTAEFLISGVGEAATEFRCGNNQVCIDIAVVPEMLLPTITQSKHHRWRLDKPQIIQYGLGAQLHHGFPWWEDISLLRRRLMFLSVRPWLTFCVLICEDLARPDPVGDLVRAVGPNLVVALLLDGPQLGTRWPSRYATVLADDPGTSVLTLTSHGMAKLSRPASGEARCDVVALWKDANGNVQEICLGPHAEAVLLNISVDYREEWTADGRGDRGVSGYPMLTGIHQIP